MVKSSPSFEITIGDIQKLCFQYNIVYYNGPLAIFFHVAYAALGYNSNSACSTTSVKAGWI